MNWEVYYWPLVNKRYYNRKRMTKHGSFNTTNTEISLKGCALYVRCIIYSLEINEELWQIVHGYWLWSWNYCNEDGTCTERFTAYHETKAKAASAWLSNEDLRPPQKEGFKCLLGYGTDEQILALWPSWNESINRSRYCVSDLPCRSTDQLRSAVISQAQSWAPSAIPVHLNPDMPHENDVSRN